MIGIFDSGCGGLTVLRAIRKRMPGADILYFGDTKNAPYGDKPREELSLLTAQALGLLRARGATSIVSACNSLSASLALSVLDALDIEPSRLIEMVGPAVSSLRDSNERILLCATNATIASGIYENAFLVLRKQVEPLAIPELAGALERGASPDELHAIVQDALTGVDLTSFDAILLACTHYPLAYDAFQAAAPGLRIIDPAEAVAERVETAWWPREAGNGKLTFLLSAPSAPFETFVGELFPDVPHTLEVLE